MTRGETRKLIARAKRAGEAAAQAMTPTPMIVQQRHNPLDDSSPVIREYAPIEGGVCGFAGIRVFPGNSRLANVLKAMGLASRDSYYGGVYWSIRAYGQSYERKMAYAGAAAAVLRDAGIEQVYADGRLD